MGAQQGRVSEPVLCWAFVCPPAGRLALAVSPDGPGPCLLMCQIMTMLLLPSVEGTRCAILNRAWRGGRTWRVPMKGTCQGYMHGWGTAMPWLVLGSLTLNHVLSATSLSLAAPPHTHTHPRAITKIVALSWYDGGGLGTGGGGRLVCEKGGR